MKWENPLTEATILKRYKRFLADIKLGDDLITTHVPNTGSMTSCWEPNWQCAVSKSSNLKRKMPYTLELTHNGESWIGVNTLNANRLVYEWLRMKLIPELHGYELIKPEIKVEDSRIDFYLDNHPTRSPCYVEVKSVTLKLDGMAQFPDSVSERGQKHLKDLMKLRSQGFRAVMFYVIQREDVQKMMPAHTIDKKYGELVKEAHVSGVEFFSYQCKINTHEMTFGGPIPFYLE